MRTTARTRPRGRIALVASALLLAAVSLVLAQGRDEYGNVQGSNQSGDAGDVQQTVARISYIEGSVSYARGDDPDNWQAADRNVPVTVGDRVYTGDRSRLELQVQGGAAIRLGAQTDLAALNLTDDTRQFSVNSGVASFRIRRLAQNEVFEIDTPNAAITIEQPGDYRLDVDQDGNSRFSVRRGSATAAAGGGQVPLQSGDEIDIQGTDNPSYDVVALGCRRRLGPMGLAAGRPHHPVGVPQVREQRRRRRRRSGSIRPLAASAPVRVGVVPGFDRRGLGPLSRRPLDLAGPVGLDLGLLGALGLGALPLRPVGDELLALVLGAAGPLRARRDLLAGAGRLRGRRAGLVGDRRGGRRRLRRMVPPRPA